jgi:hypothetical protein
MSAGNSDPHQEVDITSLPKSAESQSADQANGAVDLTEATNEAVYTGIPERSKVGGLRLKKIKVKKSKGKRGASLSKYASAR